MMEATAHASQGQKSSIGRSSSDGYYNFAYHNDASSLDDDLPRQLSPMVDKILKETEFDTRPVSGTDSSIPESNPHHLSETPSKTETDFERLEEDSCIDDDINSSELQQQSYKDLDESLAEYLDSQQGKGSRKSPKQTESAADNDFLPVQPMETALSFEDESPLESEQHGTDDTNPIIVDERSQVITTQNCLRKVKAIIGILAGIAIGATIYLLKVFLSSN